MQLERLWQDVERGELPIRDLVGLDPIFIAKIHDQAVLAFTTGRYDRAAAIFGGLEALEPDRPEHALHLAHAKAQLGETVEAIAALSRFLDRSTDPEERVRALLTRAILSGDRSDVDEARRTSGTNRDLVALVDQIGGVA
jgi:tetratricopeptide (TPR) repeat protein